MSRIRVRVTVRRTMIAVAACGLILAGIVETHRRRERFEGLFGYHWRKYPGRFCSFTPRDYSLHETWHAEMAIKYQFAATRPWLPVTPDPPTPPDGLKSTSCLCFLPISASYPRGMNAFLDSEGWETSAPRRQQRLLMMKREFLEREGWETYGGELLRDENRYHASAFQGDRYIDAEDWTAEAAWAKVLDRARASGVRLPTDSPWHPARPARLH